MEYISIILSAISVIFCIATFVVNRKDRAVQCQKEDHQELIEYQLKEIKEDNKEIKNDLKEIRRTLSNYKEVFRDMIRVELEEHVKTYHKEN